MLVTKRFYDYSINTIGKTAASLKKFRNDVGLFQKNCYAGEFSIDFMNAYRGTSKLTGLAKVLGGAGLTDFFEPISSALSYLKPVNVNTIHALKLVEQIVECHENVDRDELRVKINQDVIEFLNNLSDINQGQLFGFSDSQAFLNSFQNFVRFKHNELYSPGYEFAQAIKEVPLIRVRWGEWLTNKSFETLGLMTMVYYFREWDFINTASWAANMGKVHIFKWVNNLSFGNVFQGVILTSFVCLFGVAARKIIVGNKRNATLYGNSSIGESAKKRAPYEAVGALAETIYAGKNFLAGLGVIKNNPLFSILGVLDKTIGSICVIKLKEEPFLNQFDTPLSEVARPSLVNRINSKMSHHFSSLKKIPGISYVKVVAKKINDFATTVFEILHDFVNLEKDGFDKLYKVLVPTLKIIDRALKQNELVTNSLFKKCISSLDLLKNLIYATKFVNVIPHWITPNPVAKGFKLTTPFYVYDKAENRYKFKLIEGVSTTLLDSSAIWDLANFLHKHNIYEFKKFAKIGNQLAEKQISFLGYTAQVKNIPLLGQINKSTKNIPVALNSYMMICVQIWKRVVGGDKKQFQGKNLSDFVGHIGKATVCTLLPSDTYLYDTICLLTGASGLSYVVGQYKLRQKIKAKGAVAA